MNLFVLGPRALKDWISRMIETTRPTLTSCVPPIPLRIVFVREEADLVVKTDGNSDLEHQTISFELPDAPAARQGLLAQLELSTPDGASTRVHDAFCAAVCAVHRDAQANAVHRVVAGPFAHDVRGALSVVSLSRQLIEAGSNARGLGAKLRRADSKVSAALFDLSARTQCLTGAWPPSEKTEELVAPTFDSLSSSFADAHPERQFQLSETARTQVSRAPNWFGVALGGTLDGVARLTRGGLTLDAPASGADSDVVGIRISGETAALHPAQRRILACPERWALLPSDLVPYRLGTAALLITAARGSIRADERDGGLCVTLALP